MYVCMSGKACVYDMLVYWESKLIFQLSPGRGESVERLLLSCSRQPSSWAAHCARTRSISLAEVKLHQWARHWPAWAPSPFSSSWYLWVQAGGARAVVSGGLGHIGDEDTQARDH